jgi:hypothetical protein
MKRRGRRTEDRDEVRATALGLKEEKNEKMKRCGGGARAKGRKE